MEGVKHIANGRLFGTVAQRGSSGIETVSAEQFVKNPTEAGGEDLLSKFLIVPKESVITEIVILSSASKANVLTLKLIERSNPGQTYKNIISTAVNLNQGTNVFGPFAQGSALGAGVVPQRDGMFEVLEKSVMVVPRLASSVNLSNGLWVLVRYQNL